jgi:hypothetical protein
VVSEGGKTKGNEMFQYAVAKENITNLGGILNFVIG